jgi:hypothetical protein
MSLLIRSLLLFAVIIVGVASCRGQRDGAAQSPPPPDAAHAGAEQRPGERKEFSSERGRFAILFPGTPEEAQYTSSGRLDSRQYIFVDDWANYDVAYNDYNIDLEKEVEERNYAMNRLRDAGVSNFNGRLLSEAEVSLSGHPGRALKVSIPDGSIIRVRMYAVGRRFYQVAVTTLGEQSAPDGGRSAEARALKFLDSFRLIQPGDGVR